MDHSSDEDTDISESEISEYVEKYYEELKNGKKKVKTSEETFTCPYCPNKRKQEYLYKELLQHASGLGKSLSQKRKPRHKANHLALEKYLGKDQMAVDVSSKPADKSEADNMDADTSEADSMNADKSDALAGSDVQFVWPWTGIVVNIPTTRTENRISAGSSGSKLRDEYISRGFNPLRVSPLWNIHGHSGTALVEFNKNWEGLANALAFEKAYELAHHGKKDWLANSEQKSGLYAWVARADDYGKPNIIGDHLQKIGDLKTIKELMKEDDQKKDELVYSLTSRIEVKNQQLQDIESAMVEKDQLIKVYIEGDNLYLA